MVESLWLRTIQLSLELPGDGAHAAPRVRLLRGQNSPFAGSFYIDLCNVEAELLRQAHGLAMPVGKYLRGFYAALLEMYLRWSIRIMNVTVSSEQNENIDPGIAAVSGIAQRGLTFPIGGPTLPLRV